MKIFENIMLHFSFKPEVNSLATYANKLVAKLI